LNWSKFFSVQEKKASSHESRLQGLIVSHDACNMRCTCFATFGKFTNSTYFGKMLNTPPIKHYLASFISICQWIDVHLLEVYKDGKNGENGSSL
jgi:hypothetical protein